MLLGLVVVIPGLGLLLSVLAESIPTGLHEVRYFTHSFHWNEAHGYCRESGGHMFQPETVLEASYYRSVLDEISKQTQSEFLEFWIGMVLVERGSSSVTWVNPCHQVQYSEFSNSEPNDLDSDFCIRLVHETATRHEWRTINCDWVNPGFVCIYELNSTCLYMAENDTSLSISSENVRTEIYNTSEKSCQQNCDTRVLNGKECWALTYNTTSGECQLFYTDSWTLLRHNEHHVKKPGMVLKYKDCFKIVVRDDTDLTPSFVKSERPATPCFEAPAVTGGTSPTVQVTDTTTTTTNSQDSSVEEGTVKLTTQMEISSRSSTFEITKYSFSADISAPPKTNDLTTRVFNKTSPFSPVTAFNLETTSSPDAGSNNKCPCPCKLEDTKNKYVLQDILQDLEINKTELSSTKRKYVSVYESRETAVAVGSGGIIALLAFYVIILLTDVFHGFNKVVPIQPKRK